jgi:hypothetical protein
VTASEGRLKYAALFMSCAEGTCIDQPLQGDESEVVKDEALLIGLFAVFLLLEPPAIIRGLRLMRWAASPASTR